MSYAMPPDILIQSAATIGSRTLAAFGTTAYAPDGSTVNQLRMQMLQDTTLFGNQKSLHGDSARPYGVVSVLNLESTFVVLWNDRREGAPGIYLQRVDTNGNRSGSEQRVSPGRLTSDTGVTLIRTKSGYVVVWNDRRDSSLAIYDVQLTPTGDPVGNDLFISTGEFQQVLRYGSLSEPTVLQLNTGGPIVVTDDGLIHFDSVIPRLSTSYVVSDHEIAVLRDTSLQIYSGLFDTAAPREFAIPGLRQEYYKLISMYRDSAGRYGLIYPTTWAGSRERQFFAVKVVVDTDGTVSAPVIIDSDTTRDQTPNSELHPMNDNGSKRVRYCNNATQVNVSRHDFMHYLTNSSRSDHDVYYNYGYHVDGSGRFSRLAYNSTCERCGMSCDDRSLFPISRTKTNSAIVLRENSVGKQISVEIPKAGRPVNRRESLPNVVLQDSHLIVTWVRDGLQYLNEIYPGAIVSENWEGDTTTNSFVLHYPVLLTYADQFLTSLAYYRLPGVTLVAQTTDSAIYHPEYLPNRAWWQNYDSFTLFTVSNNGWRRVTGRNWWVGVTSSYNHDQFINPFLTGWGAAPDREGFAVTLQIPGGEDLKPFAAVVADFNDSVTTTFSQAETLWSPSSPLGVLPISMNDIWLVTDTSYMHVTDKGIVQQTQQPDRPTTETARYQKLLGPWFIRYGLVESPFRGLVAERFDFSFKRIDSIFLAQDDVVGPPSVIQNPGDSSIAILTATRTGVRLSYFDQHLQLRHDALIDRDVSEIPVSTTEDSVGSAAGVFSNDTLFVVWEDYRNGNPDIYGNWWVVPKTLRPPVTNRDTITTPTTGDTDVMHPDRSIRHDSTGAPIPGVGDVAITGLYPNPAHSYITVKFTTRTQGEVGMEIVDMLGSRIVQLDGGTLNSGRYQWGMDCSGLAPGAYVVILHSALGNDQRRVVVEPY
jgi:hypothetical protein